MTMASPAERTQGLDFAALDSITEAVESGAGLPDVVRAAARVLEASLVLLDRTGSVMAVAARSPADERSLLDGAAGVVTIELRVADEPVGQLRMRARAQPGPALVRLVTTLVASEVERVRAPARASQEASSAFLHAVLNRQMSSADEMILRSGELGVDLHAGGCILV